MTADQKIDYVYMTSPSVRKLLHTVFSTLDDQPEDRVVWETFADRRPENGPYLSLYVREMTPMWDSVPMFTDTKLDKEIYKSETRYTVDITTWGKNAFDRAQALVYMLNYETRHMDLWQYIGGGQPERIKDVSAVKGGHVLQRARFQFKFYVMMASQIKWDWFDKLKIELTLVRENSLYKVEFGNA
jgi:hypothetical protein